MITIGVDAHKRVHAAVALDAHGRVTGEWRGVNSSAGWRDLALWADGLGEQWQVGIEGAWSYGRGLAQHLVAQGVAVYEVNSRWTAAGRRHARRPDKSDRADARAVASFVLREAPGLSQITADDDTAVLDLLASERESALAEATRLRNQIHALLLQLDPEYQLHMAGLKSQAGLRALHAYASPDELGS